MRLGNAWRSQIEETGHLLRLDDIDRLADLGVRRVRFPILWEMVAPERPDRLDFRWADERLERLKARGIAVVAGLLHHGSGPFYTDLLDPDFPARLGDYSARVAEHYDWIDAWTPVNEPLTTARFSALYGHWYPHRCDYPAFLRAVVNQCLGTLEAMRAIRASNPEATLLQTEDIAKIFSTAPLRQQAAHENTRRWLSLDLLCGRVRPGHPWYDILVREGIGEGELQRFEGQDAAPDVIGVNHYLTSDRFLDHRVDLYPGMEAGGNGRDVYVDAEAVRVHRLQGQTGLEPRLRETWKRYRLPLAVTEIHHGCTRDEQLRWFAESWEETERARAAGVDVRAVTLWSVFGNVDWRSLLTRRSGHYDCGAYDARSEPPRPTIVAAAARAFASGQKFDHPVLDVPGWWRRPPRLYPWNRKRIVEMTGARPILITGATGTLGRAFARICGERGLAYRLTTRAELDICDDQAISDVLRETRPWAVVNTAGFVRVDDADKEREACFAWNALGPEKLAHACMSHAIRLVTFSSDLVFDGLLGRDYLEGDAVNPQCAYGESKAEAERRVHAVTDLALIVRTAAFFGPWDRYNFVHHVVERLSQREPFHACPETIVSPTFVPDLCHAVLDLLIDGETGLRHVANTGGVSWHKLALEVAGAYGLDPNLVIADPRGKPRKTSLGSRMGTLLRPLELALRDHVATAPRLFEEPPLPLAAE